MDGFENMSLGEVIDEVARRVENEMEGEHDLEYPSAPITAVLLVLDKARQYAAGDQLVGFAVASSFLACLVRALHVELPEGLNDRLHGRIPGS